MGNQVPLKVGDRGFSTDLLFYQTHLHCYVKKMILIKKPHPDPVYKTISDLLFLFSRI